MLPIMIDTLCSAVHCSILHIVSIDYYIEYIDLI